MGIYSIALFFANPSTRFTIDQSPGRICARALYADGELDQENYQKALKQLPDYLRRSIIS